MLLIKALYIYPVAQSISIRALRILHLIESIVGRNIKSRCGTCHREFVFLILASIFVLFLFCSRDVRCHYLVQGIYAEETCAELVILSVAYIQRCQWQVVLYRTAITGLKLSIVFHDRVVSIYHYIQVATPRFAFLNLLGDTGYCAYALACHVQRIAVGVHPLIKLIANLWSWREGYGSTLYKLQVFFFLTLACVGVHTHATC